MNGRAAVAKARQLCPNVVVMDLAMPQMNGFKAGREIVKSHHLRMLLLTVQEVSEALAREARKAGFHGAISKGKGSEVITAVETLLGEGFCLEPCLDLTS